MKKLIAIVILIALLATTNVSYGWHDADAKAKAKAEASAEIGDITNNNKNTNVNTNLNVNANKNTNKNTNLNANINKNKNINVNKNKQQQGQLQGQMQGQIQGQKQDQNQGQNQSSNNNNVNEGNKNEINISDNSSYTEMISPTDLLNPGGYVPLAEKIYSDELYTSRSIFKLQRNTYDYKELTRFANPGRFLGFLWPEWDNSYDIEIATFAKYKATKTIRVVPASTIAATFGLVKIGEASASAKNLNRSEHQVMAALAFRATQAGATVIVFKGFSRPLVKVDSFVIGGGGTQVGSPQSIFNGATGIGSSSSETLTRACVVAELYR